MTALLRALASRPLTSTFARLQATVQTTPRRFNQSGASKEDDLVPASIPSAKDLTETRLPSIEFPTMPIFPEAQHESPMERMVNTVDESETYTSLPSNFEGLPPIPPRPQYPVEWLSDADTKTYLSPLYSRQWAIAKYRPPEQKKCVFSQVLSKLFVFRTGGDAITFAGEVNSIADKLVHHPTMFLVRDRQIVVRVMTDDAYIKPYPRSAPVKWPGITIQDIRFAYRLERVWEEYWKTGRARLPRQGWNFVGRTEKSVQKWGLVHAKLWPEAERLLVLEQAGRLPSPVAFNGKKKKRNTPKWKRLFWRKRAQEAQESQESAALDAGRESGAVSTSTDRQES